MGFRDDRDALLARADAMAREAERLHRENAELRAERDEERARQAAEAHERAQLTAAEAKKRDELERLARRASSPAPAVTTPESPPRARMPRHVQLVDRSLAVRLSRWLFWAMWPSLVTLTVVTLVLTRDMRWNIFIWQGIVLGIVVAMFGLNALISRIDARLERQWVADPGFPLDAVRYLTLLGMEQGNLVVRATLRWEAAPSGADRELVERVARAGRQVSEVRWEGDELVIESRPQVTHFRGKGGSHHNNRRVHLWVRRLARRVIVPIHAAFPCEHVVIAKGS
jgi:hypothetical protein